ncbi:pre-RNA processing PIH1/Nop17-domain-containing protein [Cantharellus anzutake]|uniref:pre-RNA processing PIH1/Nop17-domain-containing protein n=1 Tax=Cantharellus anzutake TaxID=1750568 RepID=UPI001905B8E0|nr:pre-RNA processing PIH1/Nop17-domain-containing protein [Cantharellus anzutake]KAF8335692.1 pre-RNA processing PIH1/Nop17-domain-containing protein [Cantharellus anzutake]
MNARTKRVELNPVAGFVVKTICQTPGVYTPRGLPPDSDTKKQAQDASNKGILDIPEPVLKSIPVPAGLKIFVNIAYDDAVPPPPKASESDIRKAMAGDDGAYYVPVIVSDGREVLDKGGNASLVFDTIFNTSIRERVSKDLDYRTFITEIALERVEDKSGLTLGRDTAKPVAASSSKLLIEELAPSDSKSPSSSKPAPTSILKSSKGPHSPRLQTIPVPSLFLSGKYQSKMPLQTYVEQLLPLRSLTWEHHSECTVDLEPNRLIFTCQSLYAHLDVPILTSFKAAATNTKVGLNVDEAKAQWIVGEGKLVITAPITTS